MENVEGLFSDSSSGFDDDETLANGVLAGEATDSSGQQSSAERSSNLSPDATLLAHAFVALLQGEVPPAQVVWQRPSPEAVERVSAGFLDAVINNAQAIALPAVMQQRGNKTTSRAMIIELAQQWHLHCVLVAELHRAIPPLVCRLLRIDLPYVGRAVFKRFVVDVVKPAIVSVSPAVPDQSFAGNPFVWDQASFDTVTKMCTEMNFDWFCSASSWARWNRFPSTGWTAARDAWARWPQSRPSDRIEGIKMEVPVPALENGWIHDGRADRLDVARLLDASAGVALNEREFLSQRWLLRIASQDEWRLRQLRSATVMCSGLRWRSGSNHAIIEQDLREVFVAAGATWEVVGVKIVHSQDCHGSQNGWVSGVGFVHLLQCRTIPALWSEWIAAQPEPAKTAPPRRDSYFTLPTVSTQEGRAEAFSNHRRCKSVKPCAFHDALRDFVKSRTRTNLGYSLTGTMNEWRECSLHVVPTTTLIDAQEKSVRDAAEQRPMQLLLLGAIVTRGADSEMQRGAGTALAPRLILPEDVAEKIRAHLHCMGRCWASSARDKMLLEASILMLSRQQARASRVRQPQGFAWHMSPNTRQLSSRPAKRKASAVAEAEHASRQSFSEEIAQAAGGSAAHRLEIKRQRQLAEAPMRFVSSVRQRRAQQAQAQAQRERRPKVSGGDDVFQCSDDSDDDATMSWTDDQGDWSDEGADWPFAGAWLSHRQ